VGRAAQAEEIAPAILWLLSPAAAYTTGAVIRVAAGLYAG
jgi:NAD(P)-dependent dehydrogenase (short-subunit alcohol dehydrogenase family)